MRQSLDFNLSFNLKHRISRNGFDLNFSTVQTCRMGIPQCSMLGPWLFRLYRNDLPNIWKRAKCQMYVYDPIVHVPAKTPKMAAETLSQWLQNYHLTLTYKKTVSMCSSIKRKANKVLHSCDRNWSGRRVLRCYFRFSIEVQSTCEEAVQNCQNQFKVLSPKYTIYIPLNAAQQFMHAMIFSHLWYSITVWGKANQTTLATNRY